MRVHIYEEKQEVLRRLCRELGVSPTKMINELISHLDDTVCQNTTAKDKDDLLARFNRT